MYSFCRIFSFPVNVTSISHRLNIVQVSKHVDRRKLCGITSKANLLYPPRSEVKKWKTLITTVKFSSRTYEKWKTLLSRTKSSCTICSTKAVIISGGLGCFYLWKVSNFKVHCEYKAKKSPPSRLTGQNSKDSDETDDNQAPFPWQLFLKALWPDIWYIIGAVLSAFVVAVVNIQIPLLLGEVVNVVSKCTEQQLDFLSEIKKPAIKLLNMYGLQSMLTFVYISLLSAVGERLATRMRSELFYSIIIQDIAFFDSHKTGEIVNRITSDVQDFKSSFKLCISQGLRSFTQTVGCVVSLCLISTKLTGVMLVVVPGIIAVGTLLGSGLRKMSRKAQAQVAKATGVADEAIGNVRTVRAFAMENKEMLLYQEELEHSSKLNQYLGVGIGAFQALSNFALNGIVLGTLYIGGSLMSTNELKPGDLMSFMVATQTIQRSLTQISVLFGQAVRGLSAGARVYEYTQFKPNINQHGGKRIPYHSLNGDVCFKNVSFTYPTRPNQDVLKNFSIDIQGGHMVALVGLSGGGKSTVAALLERFYDVTGGSVCIDGEDIRDLDPAWLRGRVLGYINQEPVLFATTVMENIRYGQPDATDEQVIEAAKQANAHDFVIGFSDGYQTILGERGVTVSGGQKQRIAIARALIKNPAILILDEATSALDAESERVVQEALDKVTKGRTVLVIAHRLSTIKNADVIAVMSNGEIVERGNHETLKKKKGLYWDLIKQQETRVGGGGTFASFFRRGE